MDNKTDIEIIQDESSEYWEIDKKTISDFLYVICLGLFYLAYKQIEFFREFILKNWGYIKENYDLYLLFFLVFVIPLILYGIYLVSRIVKWFWVSYDFVKIRVLSKVFRINFSIFGITALILAFSLKKEFSSWLVAGISLGLLILFNLFFIDYSGIYESEKKLAKLNQKSKFKMPELTYLQIIFLIGFFPSLILYIGNESFKLKIDEIYLIISADLPLLIIFYVVIVFSALWWLISFIASLIVMLIETYEDKLVFAIKLVGFVLFIFFFAKLFVFNIPKFADEPVPTFISLGITLVSTAVQRNGKRIVGFFHKRKQGGDFQNPHED